MCEQCDRYTLMDTDLTREEAIALGLITPDELWMTQDGRLIDVRTMDRHHAYNLLNWADRNGVRLGEKRRAMIEERLGEVGATKEKWYQLRNKLWLVVHGRVR